MTVVSQYDINLILAIEEFINDKLIKVTLPEDEVLEDQGQLMKVMQVVRIKMAEQGLDEKFKVGKKREHPDKSSDLIKRFKV